MLMFVGRLGAVQLAAVALSASYCNVLGFSLGIGMLSALDTLCSQAFGAKQLDKIGKALHQSFLVMACLTLIVCPVWMVRSLLSRDLELLDTNLSIQFAGQVLSLLGQDAEVVALSSTYIRIVWIGLFPALVYSTLRRYLQNQNIVLPSVLSGISNIVIAVASLSILMLYFDFGWVFAPFTLSLMKVTERRWSDSSPCP